jgi:geranylgeranyl diphosphate synthase, type I
MRKFGIALGLAFQAVDDWLGIWGNAQMIGKSTESDLVTGKKTLPVVYALANDENFAQVWNISPILPEEVATLADLLVQDGTQKFVEQTADDLTRQALEALDLAGCNNSKAGEALVELTQLLLTREH